MLGPRSLQLRPSLTLLLPSSLVPEMQPTYSALHSGRSSYSDSRSGAGSEERQPLLYSVGGQAGYSARWVLPTMAGLSPAGGREPEAWHWPAQA